MFVAQTFTFQVLFVTPMSNPQISVSLYVGLVYLRDTIRSL